MEQEINEDRVAKGFNDGFLISQHDADLANDLKGKIQQSTDEYIIGFQKGLVELDKEKKLTDEFNKIREQGNELEKDIER
ncbi:MAG: hypothetical protein U0T31_00580 [Chitinophagales bacterium]